MTTLQPCAQQAAIINELLRKVPREQWAVFVIAFAKDHGIETTLTPELLERGMGQMPYYSQGPANFLDLIRAVHAIEAGL